MQNIVIDKKGSQLDVERKRLLIKHDSLTKSLSIPFDQIKSITITTHVDLNSHLVMRLAEHDISVCLLPSSRTGAACFLLGSWHAGTERREMQYHISNNEAAKSYWAATVVRLKLHGQAQTLSQLTKYAIVNNATLSASEIDYFATLTTIEKIKSLGNKFRKHRSPSAIQLQSTSIDVNSNLNCNTYTHNHAHAKWQTLHYHSWLPQYPVASILGTEGIGSALYFHAYQQFFADNLQFNSRNRRPPTDPVNVVLSLSYTLLQHICQQAVYSIGFDPYHGVLHRPSYGRQSLACDFTELQRASIDFWVWQLFKQNILTLDDFGFSSTSSYPCELLKSGRAKYYQAFAAIRADLSKNALNHVWIWQRRLNNYHSNQNLTVKESNLLFISQLPMT